MKKISRRLGALALAGSFAAALAGAGAAAVPAYGAGSTALQSAVSQVEQMDVGGYTDQSVALLQKALDSSAQVLQDESAGSLRINNHVTLLDAAARALVKKPDGDSPVCGNYTIEGILRQASSDSPSMGNASIIKPMEVVVEEDGITLRLEFTYLTVPGLGQGYLSDLSWLPGWEGKLQEMTQDQYQAFQGCTVQEYHEGVYDLFNDPDTGTDAAIRGKLYPKYLTMPVDYLDPEVWVRVYVPIMESISTGGGTQYARLQMDWDTLTWTEPDKSALQEAADQLVQLKGAIVAADYPQEMTQLLDAAAAAGKDALSSTSLGQSQTDALAQALIAVGNLFADADKQYLYDMIQLAKGYTGSDYTESYTEDMKKRIQAAQAVYNDASATQTQVNEQYALLLQAVSNPQKKELAASPTPAPSGTQKPDSTPTPQKPESPTGTSEEKLDKNNLKDGIYAVTGKMVKIDKSTLSMSNDAINHTIKLAVEKGKYKVTMDFMGLNISGRYGYLSGLKYFKQGYTLDSYGAPQGTAGEVTVDSYQLDESGGRISDTYGTDYPNQVTFPLIPEAVKDGYVPLQVYVPIMEAISAGTGTQPVFLFLDWDSLESALEDDERFQEQGNSNQGGTTGTAGGTSLIGGTSQLKGGTSFLTQGTGTAKSAITAAKRTDTVKKTGTKLSARTAQSGSTLSEEGLSNNVMEENAGAENQETDTAEEDQSSGSSPRLPSPAAIPTVMSVLMAAAGVLFKLKTKGGL